MKKIFLGVSACVCLLTFAGCSNGSKNKDAKEETKDCYTIKVTDYDGKEIGSETIKIGDYSNVWDALDAKFDVTATYSAEYGHFISKVNGSLVDPAWSLYLYENGEEAGAGIDNVVADKDDVFELRCECYKAKSYQDYPAVYDDYDVLVDKVLYNYIKTDLKSTIEAATTYESSIYWQQCTVNLMATALTAYGTKLYDDSLLSFTYTKDFKDSLTNADLSKFNTMPEYTYAKYYYGLRATNSNMDAFKSVFTTYLDNLETYDAPIYGWGAEYCLPFNLSAAKTLGLESHVKDSVKNTEFRASTQWGTDGLAWQLAQMPIYTTIAESELDAFTIQAIDTAYSKDISLSLYALPYAAMNKSTRHIKDSNGKDWLEILFTNYYNAETGKFESHGETLGNASQIYASLMAYKVQRDTGKAAYIFA